MFHFKRTAEAMVLVSALFAGSAYAETLKIAYIDPLSGAFAGVGDAGLKQFQFVADDINKRNLTGGPKLEVIGFDNKVSPKESLNVLKKVIDQGIRVITQGNGSSVAGVLIDAVNKHNERNPDKSILFLNYAAVDPDFTNSKCSFWHFRFDANSDMKMEAMTDFMAKDKSIKSVYLINQDYSFGQAVTRAAKEYLARKRPDIKIVGDDLHPIGKVKDFAPYVAKIKASNADVVISGNWGADASLLIKAAKDAGLSTPFYTYYFGGLGSMTAMGDAGVGKVKQITEFHSNIKPNKTEKFANAFNAKYGGPPNHLTFYYLRVNNEMYMLARAIKETKSIDPKKIALKLEGMKFESDTGEVEMRATDHQLIQPLYISTVAEAYRDPKNPKTAKFKGTDPDVKYDVEDSGLGFKTDARIEGYVTAQPTSCQMKRP
ncbi:MAG: branched-chain amino acid ABC transporter substrate-binding protein [Burkholderiales bacterium]|nr:branched-chain amino acid ABC transporter substrate-binding protein [Burkholderiales bacterium]